MRGGRSDAAGTAIAMADVAAVVIPCSSRKRLEPDRLARAVSLPRASQDELETAWLNRLNSLERPITARDLYSGRGALLGRQAARAASAPLYIASAGLGLVGENAMVPAYSITVARRGDDAIPSRTVGRFDPGAWWAAVCAGPISTTLEQVFAGGEGRIALVALTKSYAAMLADSLMGLPERAVAGLRLFGWGLRDNLPASLHGSIMGYDARLEAALPGTRSDFAQRALTHFVANVLPLGAGNRERHRDLVEQTLATLKAPRRATRARASDAEILTWLGRPEQAGGGIGRLLRRIRDEGIACEQSRFSCLYVKARQQQSEGAMRQ